MKMHFLVGGRIRIRKSIYLPTADRSETFELPVSSVLLRHVQGNVLFDTGCHPDVATDAESRWGWLTKFMTPVMTKDDTVVVGLAGMGLTPGDIDVVICSHFHVDHCGCNVFFNRATLIVHARELEAARAPGAEERGYLPIEWDHPLATDAIEGERDVFGDGRIVLLPLPGHTPGTLGALVELERSGRFLLASDALSLRETLDGEFVPRNTWDTDAFVKSLAEIRRIGARGATIICGHDPRQWETLRKGAEAYE